MKNRHYYYIELKRAFSQKTMQLSIGIGLFLSIWHFIQWPVLRMQPVSNVYMGQPTYPLSAFEYCLSSLFDSLPHAVFFFIFPVLAALPYGTSLFEDNQSGFAKNLYIRVERPVMRRARGLAVFLSGAVAVTLPLIFDFLLTGCVLPLIVPDVTATSTPLQERSMWNSIFFAWPSLYLLLYLLLDFLFGGLYAVLAMFGGNLLSNRFVVLLLPLLFQMAVGYIAELFSAWEWIPERFLAMSQLPPTALWRVGGVALVLLTVFFVFYERSRKNEIIL